MSKRYFWLKLQDGFFGSLRIKKLRRIAGGDTYTIIYLKMQLKAIRTDGKLYYTGLESSFAEELAIDLDEDVENVKVTINYLLNTGLMESDDGETFFLPYVVENTGSETASTIRSRESRSRKKALQCNTNATLLQQKCSVEIEKEKEKELEIELEVSAKPTLDDVRSYASEISSIVDPDRFYDHYAAIGWKIGSNPIKDWKAVFRNWSRNEPQRNQTTNPKAARLNETIERIARLND